MNTHQFPTRKIDVEPGIDSLKSMFPWPREKPEAVMDVIGTFPEQGTVWKAIEYFLPTDAKLIVELGTFYGASLRFMALHATQATLVAVDTWLGSPEFFLRKIAPPIDNTRLYEQFCKNMWDMRERIIPVRNTTLNGLSLLLNLEIKPDFVYVDAAHDALSVLADLVAISSLGTGIRIVGDDYDAHGVQDAVQRYKAHCPGIKLEAGNRWFSFVTV